MRVVNVGDSEIGLEGGMARVAWHWKRAFENRGHEFLHIGTKEIGNLPHIRHFPKAALRYYHEHIKNADIALVHEPAAGVFAQNGIKTAVVSHGLERRYWEIQHGRNEADFPNAPLKTRLLLPFWRLRGCDVGLRNSDGALLINQDDRAFAMERYGVRDENLFVFKNGVDLPSSPVPLKPENANSILFLGAWFPRKGIYTLARAAKELHDRGVNLNWILAGTGASAEEVLADWPECLRDQTQVIPKFTQSEEAELFERCNLFVLPSFFEGQPLALLQAMAAGRCCITTNICGQKDIIIHRSNGLLFEPGDAGGLANLIEETTSEMPLQISRGENARKTVEKREWTTVAAEVVNFIEQLARKNGA